jgi:hypothetical protein
MEDIGTGKSNSSGVIELRKGDMRHHIIPRKRCVRELRDILRIY